MLELKLFRLQIIRQVKDPFSFSLLRLPFASEILSLHALRQQPTNWEDLNLTGKSKIYTPTSLFLLLSANKRARLGGRRESFLSLFHRNFPEALKENLGCERLMFIKYNSLKFTSGAVQTQPFRLFFACVWL